jgi:hypothetical protein
MSNPQVRYRYRSFFWPALLILIGIFALLVNSNLIPVDRLYRLGDLWPLILVVIGLELIVRRALQGVAGEIAAALIVLIAAGGAVAYVATGAAIPGGTHSLDSSQPIENIQQAALQIDVGGATLKIHGSSSLGDTLYQAHIDYSGPAPTVNLDRSSGQLRISQNSSNFTFFQDRRFALDLQISTQVPWTISANSGAVTDTFDLSTVRVGSIELNTGASQENITLGPPSGTVPITINGGALTVHIHRPSGTAASVDVSGGVVNLSADGQEHHAIGSASWSSGSAADSYRIHVSGGACTVTIDTSSPGA